MDAYSLSNLFNDYQWGDPLLNSQAGFGGSINMLDPIDYVQQHAQNNPVPVFLLPQKATDRNGLGQQTTGGVKAETVPPSAWWQDLINVITGTVLTSSGANAISQRHQSS